MARVLMASYGGGHVQSLIPLACALQADPGVDLILYGFTTARAAFERAGLTAKGYDTLLTPEDAEWWEFAKPYTPTSNHPDISQSETDAYYALGLRDLAREIGKDAALARFAEIERKAFLPVALFEGLLRDTAPDLVITSTSPRSELALQRAANNLGIENMAVSDLFLQAEADYICAPGYARHVTVMGDYVADHLRAQGYQGQIHVTGNPAFDPLRQFDLGAARDRLRGQLGLGNGDHLILWICPSAPVSMIGKPFVKPRAIVDFLDDLCAGEGLHYLVRQHPSQPILGDIVPRHGRISPPGTGLEASLAAADVVLLETSTVGLQAALIGTPVVSIDAGDYPPYAALGLSQDVATLGAQAGAALRAPTPPDLDGLGYPPGLAADRVLAQISAILEQRHKGQG